MLGDSEMLGVILTEGEGLAVSDVVPVLEEVAVEEEVSVEVAVEEEVPDEVEVEDDVAELLLVSLLVAVEEEVPVAVAVLLPLLVAVAVAVAELVDVALLVAVALLVDDDVEDSEMEGVMEGVTEMVGVGLGVGVWLGEQLCTSVTAQSLPPFEAVDPVQNPIAAHGWFTLKFWARFTAAGSRVYGDTENSRSGAGPVGPSLELSTLNTEIVTGIWVPTKLRLVLMKRLKPVKNRGGDPTALGNIVNAIGLWTL